VPLSSDAAILRSLRDSGDAFVAGSDLGEPADVAAHVAILRAAGYEIEHHPHLGYRLLGSPGRLIADDILSRLPESRWIREVLVFQRTKSTNDVISSLARQGAPAGVVAFAEEQTAGRGRLGRRWQSDPSLGLWFSVLLRPEMPFAEWPRLTLWIAYAVAHGIQRHAEETMPASAGVEIMLKWPNDLYGSGRKLAGILVESSTGENAFATAGIGLNVNHASFPSPLDTTATSLRIQTGWVLDRNALAAAILTSIDQTFSLMPSHFEQVLDWASKVDYLRGRWVSATAGTSSIEGCARGLDTDGALLISTSAGTVTRVTSGEITRFSTIAS
jgi:BirA family biotin operon repressor/biotin-[acetyl-CoA-carboxylase] ligase